MSQHGNISAVQKHKLDHIFDTFYDVNRDGVIQWNDFELAIEKISELNGWSADSPKRKHAVETLTRIWEGLKKHADQNSDNQVTKQEWYKMWSECIDAVQAKQEFPFWLSSYMTFMFDATDTSGDNVIDANEFSKAFSAFGLTSENTAKAFEKISDGGATQLNRENYNKLWHEYIVASDAHAKGNYLFGYQTFE